MTDIVPHQENNVIQSYDDVMEVAKAMVKSGYFSDSQTLSKAIVKILAGREIGVGPFASMNGIHIITGKPSFGANLMADRVKSSGKYNYRLITLSDSNCEIDFYELWNGKWEKTGTSAFSLADAKKAGTKNLDKIPRNMLFARAMSNGVRWYCPDVMSGSTVYTPEELGANVDEDGNVIEGTFVERSDAGVISSDEYPIWNAQHYGDDYARHISPVTNEEIESESQKASQENGRSLPRATQKMAEAEVEPEPQSDPLTDYLVEELVEKPKAKAEAKGKPRNAETAEPLPFMTLEEACKMTNSQGKLYGETSKTVLEKMLSAMWKQVRENNLEPEEKDVILRKISAAKTVLEAKQDGSIN